MSFFLQMKKSKLLRDLRFLLKFKTCSFCQVTLLMDPSFFPEDGKAFVLVIELSGIRTRPDSPSTELLFATYRPSEDQVCDAGLADTELQ